MKQLRKMAGQWALYVAMALVALPIGAAFAQGNLAAAYPGPDCGTRPTVPVRPKVFQDNDQINAYNASVRRFNEDNRKYVACVQRYADAAAEDIRVIRAQVKAVIRAASAPP